MYNCDLIRMSIESMREGINPNRYHIFMIGPYGTGKSHIIKLITYDFVHLFRSANAIYPKDTLGHERNPEDPKALHRNVYI